MSDERLTDKAYWESAVISQTGDEVRSERSGLKARIVDRWFGPVRKGFSRYLLYDVICRRYLPKGELKILEIGSSPGNELIALNRLFGYQPFGVEYNESGVDLNRKNFAAHGLPEENVIRSDVFDSGFQDEHREKYDIVMSLGFIEHFRDLSRVIDAHANLVKPGGHLLITVPNFRWFNYLLIRLMSPTSIKAHNFWIMKRKNLISVIDPEQFDVKTCRFFGGVSFGLIHGRKKSRVKQVLMKILLKLQEPIDAFFYLVSRNGWLESALFSSKLAILCQKKKPS